MPAITHMAGFFMRGLRGISKKQQPQPQKLMQGGLVRGPGTGTSDSIEARVPSGSYIMPADSTQKLGIGGLQNLGKPAPVNLSNGEYQLPPEQVHAVGVQALNQMKAATHTPVSPDQVQGQGLGLKPQMFFADGGVVPDFYVADDGTVRSKDEYRARSDTAARAKADSAAWQAEREATASQYRPASGEPPAQKPIDSPKKAAGLSGSLGRAALAGLSGISEGEIAYANTEKVAADPRSSELDVAAEASRGVSRTAGAIAGSLGGARLGGMAGPIGAGVGGIVGGAIGAAAPEWIIKGARALGVPAPDVTAETARQPQSQQIPSKPQQAGGLPKSATVAKPAPVAAQVQASQSGQPPQTQPAAVGNGWTHTGIGSGKSQVVGRVGASGVPEFTNDPTAISGATEMPDKGVGGLRSGRTFTQMQPGDSQRALDEFKRANEIYADMNQMRRGQELGDNGNQLAVIRDSSRAPTTTELLNARFENEQARQGMARQELGMRQQQLNAEQRNAAAGLGLKARELNIAENSAELGNQRTQQEIDAGGLALAQQRQIQTLRDRIVSSTDQRERSVLTEQLSALLGREATPNRFTVVPGGQEFDSAAGLMVNRPARVINNQTGQWVDQQGTSASAGMTLVGYSNGKPVYKDASGKTYIDN